MSLTKDNLEFFVVGGTLHHDSPSYIKRLADNELFNAAAAGEFCYVLTARQMGKSSLMVRTAARLKAQGICTAIIDLTKIGTGIPAEQWYLGLLMSLVSQLNFRTNPQGWWQENAGLSPVQRFTEFLHDVILAEIDQRLVILIDEIDTTLRLDFSDDFFAAIRSIYNARATEPLYNRVTFILLGVALPTDLIEDRQRTPFNIGFAIDLCDFRRRDAQPLQQGLQALYGERSGPIFDRIFYWTGGHPYLTQKLCAAVAAHPGRWTNKQIDLLVDRLFLSEEARREVNLQFIRRSLRVSPQRRELMKLYRRVYEAKKVAEDDRSLEQNQLKLFGLVRAEEGVLQVRNRIYRHAFNLDWIKANTPVDWTRRIFRTAVIIALLLLVVYGFSSWQQNKQTPEAIAAQVLIDAFNDKPNSVQRLGNLTNLFELGEGEYAITAFELFDNLPVDAKIALFADLTPGTDEAPDATLQAQVKTVIQGVYGYYLENTVENNQILEAMQSAASRSNEVNPNLRHEIKSWVNGRNLALQGDHATAIKNYDAAIICNPDNPAIYFDRAASRLALGQNEPALKDLEQVLALNKTLNLDDQWTEPVTNLISTDPQLRNIVLIQQASFPHLGSVVK